MPASETVFRPPPLLGGRGDVISAPFPWNFTGEDNLRIVLANSLVGVAARIQGRFLEKAALQPGAFDRDFTPTADRLPTTFDLSMGEGALLDCSVSVVSGSSVSHDPPTLQLFPVAPLAGFVPYFAVVLSVIDTPSELTVVTCAT